MMDQPVCNISMAFGDEINTPGTLEDIGEENYTVRSGQFELLWIGRYRSELHGNVI